ncbi:MAG TPA: hypothetical protein VGD75_19155 [Bradyrhizobium sp.]
MRKLILTTAVLAVVAASPAVARGGHGHGHSLHGRQMHRHVSRALSAPANPAVPPSLTPDGRPAGSAPLPSRRQSKSGQTSSPEKRNPEDVKLDRKIGSICRGC